MAKARTQKTPDEYIAQNIFWVPPEARWPKLQGQAHQPTIGRAVDDAMIAIERDNPALKEVLPREYARPALDKTRLGQVVDMVSNIKVGGAEARATDVLGNVYEYFLEQFALAEGRKGGEFYTPRSVVRLLVEMLEPYQGRVYDPCCGSSGMFVQSVEFIRAHASGNGNGGKARGDISIYGQESNYTTWRMARMNLAIRGINGSRSSRATASAMTATRTCGPTTSSQIPPSTSPIGVASSSGMISGGSTASRRQATPTSPGYSTSCITLRHGASQASSWPTALCRRPSPARVRYARTSSKPAWWTASLRCRANSFAPPRYRPASGSCAAADIPKVAQARPCSSTHASLGHMLDRTRRDLSPEDIARIAPTPTMSWRGSKDAGEYEDVPGFCKSANLEEIRKHGHVLTPGRYVGAAPQEDDGEPFAEKMVRLSAQWREQQAEAQRLDAEIEANLQRLGFGGGREDSR